jgi:hypothetical protein
MVVPGYGGGVSVWQNKNPTAGWQWGSLEIQRIRTRLPRHTTAARPAAGLDSNYDSRAAQ